MSLDDLPPAKRAKFAFTVRSRGKAGEARRMASSALEEAPADGETHAFATLLLCEEVPIWHWSIVRDAARNDAYDAALRRAMAAGARRVVDIGSGTGLLAMMAARAGAERVVSCEMNPTVAERAAEIVRRNGFADRVRIVARHSRDLAVGGELDAPADVLVSEIISNNMFGQDVLSVHEDAVARVLKPGGQVIPAVGSVMVALGYFEGADERRMDMVSGFDLSPFDALARPSYSVAADDRRIVLRSEAVELMRYSFATPDGWPKGTCRARVAAAGGPVNTVLSWVRLEMDDSGAPGSIYENRPAPGAWSCWAVRVHPLPREVTSAPGEPITLAGCRFDRQLLIWRE